MNGDLTTELARTLKAQERHCSLCGALLELTFGRCEGKWRWHHPAGFKGLNEVLGIKWHDEERRPECPNKWRSIRFEDRAEAIAATEIFQPAEVVS